MLFSLGLLGGIDGILGVEELLLHGRGDGLSEGPPSEPQQEDCQSKATYLGMQLLDAHTNLLRDRGKDLLPTYRTKLG
jgi:hypothetical protein